MTIFIGQTLGIGGWGSTLHTVVHTQFDHPHTASYHQNKTKWFCKWTFHVFRVEEAIITWRISGNANFCLAGGHASYVNCKACNFRGGRSIRNAIDVGIHFSLQSILGVGEDGGRISWGHWNSHNLVYEIHFLRPCPQSISFVASKSFLS